MVLVLWLWSMCVGQQSLPNANSAIDKMVASRRAFATADLSWTVSSSDNHRIDYYRNQYDGRSWTFIKTKDTDGVVEPDLLGRPFACSEKRYLVSPERVWLLTEHQASALEWGDYSGERLGRFGIFDQRIVDARTIGLAPELASICLDDFKAATFGSVNPDKMSVDRDDNGLIVLSADFGPISAKWWIDEKRNFSPVRTEHRASGTNALRSSSEMRLALYDGHVWWPSDVTHTSYVKSGPRTTKIVFISAEFDRPSHPLRLTPSDIGVVQYNQINMQGKPAGVGAWDAKTESVLTIPQMMELRPSKEDRAEWLRRMDWCADSGNGRWPAWMSDPLYGVGKPADVDAWETYVRRFCIIHKLDDRQKASARSILDDCRKHAGPIVAAIKKEPESKHKADRVRIRTARIEQIFTDSLVPRLKALLTIPQSQPASQPAAVSHGR